LGELAAHAFGKLIALGTGQASGQKLYDHRIGVERGEGLEIRCAPLPQLKPHGHELGHRSLSVRSAALQALARAPEAGIIERIVMV
jgi:hypothetical protein